MAKSMHECILKARHPESENHKSKSFNNSKGQNRIVGTGRSTGGHGGKAIVKRWDLSLLRNETTDGEQFYYSTTLHTLAYTNYFFVIQGAYLMCCC